jgi:spore coat polysaccharide biosynthesis protein SpsF
MGSQRLPGKVLLPLAGRPLVGHIFDRLRATQGVDALVLATTVDPRNDPLAAFAEKEGAAVYRGTGEDDIAGRLAGAARLAKADAILKVNGDCPLVDPAILSLLVARFRAGEIDYVSNKIRWTWPEGMSAEVIATSALAWCDANLVTAEDRELVANHIRDNRSRFRVSSVEGPEDLTRYKWSVDTRSDFDEVAGLFDALYTANPLFGVADILDVIASSHASLAAR